MEVTRRSVLSTAATVGLGVGIAGCLGDEGNGTDEIDDPPEPPVAGDPDASVTVTVYEDFSCPACLAFKQGVYPVLEEQYLEPGEIRYEHRDFPVVNDDWSWYVPSAAREVYETEGDEAFWSFADEIYAHQGSYSFEAIESVADDLGLDGAAAREAAEDERHRSVIEDNQAYGEAAGVPGTPGVVVDGDVVEFVESDDFQTMALERTTEAIEAALE